MDLKSCFVAALLALALTGCNRPSEPPEPYTAAELPAALQQAFTKAPAEIKVFSDQIVSAFQAQDYSKSFLVVQTLASRPGLTKEQVAATTRATLTISGLLQEAQTKGDQAATRTLESYQRNK